eukprot:403349742
MERTALQQEDKLQNIKVCMRLRPIFQHEKQASWLIDSSKNSIKIDGANQGTNKNFDDDPIAKLIQKQNESNKRQFGQLGNESVIDGQKTTKSTFVFDKIYQQSASNNDLYYDSCKNIIDRVTQGYNGKTHTMVGNKDQRGIIQTSIADIISFTEEVKEEREVSVWVSYMEIYNETCNDLLDSNNNNLKIREDPSEGYYVSGLKSMRVYSNDDVMKILALGERSRHYRQTDINEHSSRSHTIFRIIVENRSKESKRVIDNPIDFNQNDNQEVHLSYGTKYSVLNLVDLAGSERISESGSSALEETSHINKSLFVLANVIYKLSDSKTQHIPYRDSKLTQILRSALGGNSLTSIICTISPNQEHVSQSFSTLRFATRAKNVENKAKINEVIDDHEMLKVYKQKVGILEKRVQHLESTLAKNSSTLDASQQTLEQYRTQVQDQEQIINDYKFEVEQLRYDNQNLSENFGKEKQTGELIRKMYNKVAAREFEDAQIQTESEDTFSFFQQIIERIKEQNNLKNIVVSEKNQMEMFYEYYEFEKKIKSQMINAPLRSQKKANDIQALNFHPQRPDTASSVKSGVSQTSIYDLSKVKQISGREILRQEGLLLAQEQKQRLVEEVKQNQQQINGSQTTKASIQKQQAIVTNRQQQFNQNKTNRKSVISSNTNHKVIGQITQNNFNQNAYNTNVSQQQNQSNVDLKQQENYTIQKVNQVNSQVNYNSSQPYQQANNSVISSKEVNRVQAKNERSNSVSSSKSKTEPQQTQQIQTQAVQTFSGQINFDSSNQNNEVIQPLSVTPSYARLGLSTRNQQSQRVFDNQDFEDMKDLEDEVDLQDREEDLVDEYRAEDELEDMLSQVDSHSIYTDGSQVEAMIVKFNVHKQKREQLEQDLNDKNVKKPKRGINTYFFGDNRQGKCGLGNDDPFVMDPKCLFNKFKDVISGHHHNLALDSNKSLYSWGRNRFGQLGQGNEENLNTFLPNLLGLGDFVDRYEPEHVKILAEHQIRQISAGYLHSGAVTSDGKLFMWGANPDCRLIKKLDYYKKSGRPKNYCNPQYCDEMSQRKIVQVSCGTTHTLLLDYTGYAYAGGSSDNGQLGVIHYQFAPKTCEQPYVLVSAFSAQNPGMKVSAGDGFSMFLDKEGQIFCCGKGNFGRLGLGHQYNINNPLKISWFTSKQIKVKDVVAGGRHCLALSDEEVPQLYGWGFGFYYQFGLGEKDQEDYLEPVKIQIVKDENRKVKKIAAGYFHSGVIIK